MKAGVMTWRLRNYGIALQAYALNRFLSKCQYQAYLQNNNLQGLLAICFAISRRIVTPQVLHKIQSVFRR